MNDKIPMLLIRHKSSPPLKEYPMLASTYPFYGDGPNLRVKMWLPLIKSGVTFALLCPPGGNIKGNGWWLAGRGKKAETRVTGTMACLHHLRDEGLCDPSRMALVTASAGGMIGQLIAKREPSLLCANVLVNPVLDVLARAMDPNSAIGLALRSEYSGQDPKEDPAAFILAESLSGLRRIVPHAVTETLVFCSFVDHRMPFTKACEYVFELRKQNTGNSNVQLYMNFSGHFGPIGRFAEQERFAIRSAWLMDIFRRTYPATEGYSTRESPSAMLVSEEPLAET